MNDQQIAKILQQSQIKEAVSASPRPARRSSSSKVLENYNVMSPKQENIS